MTQIIETGSIETGSNETGSNDLPITEGRNELRQQFFHYNHTPESQKPPLKEGALLLSKSLAPIAIDHMADVAGRNHSGIRLHGFHIHRAEIGAVGLAVRTWAIRRAV